jgi:hypothetical protein
MNCGSADSFHVWTTWGLRPNARQIRDTADCVMPADRAIDRVDQCVSPPGGACSSVVVMTCSTCSSLIVRGRPGRGSSVSPSSRSRTNRPRHFDTMSRETPSSPATAVIVPPSAHARMIRDRSASACAVFRRRTHALSVRRSSAVSERGTSFGLGTAQAYQLRPD